MKKLFYLSAFVIFGLVGFSSCKSEILSGAGDIVFQALLPTQDDVVGEINTTNIAAIDGWALASSSPYIGGTGKYATDYAITSALKLTSYMNSASYLAYVFYEDGTLDYYDLTNPNDLGSIDKIGTGSWSLAEGNMLTMTFADASSKIYKVMEATATSLKLQEDIMSDWTSIAVLVASAFTNEVPTRATITLYLIPALTE